MTATFTDRVLASHVSGDHVKRATMHEVNRTPGTLWERVGEQSALERAKAAHPAGKGIRHEEVQ